MKLRQFFGIVCAESKPTQVAFAFLDLFGFDSEGRGTGDGREIII